MKPRNPAESQASKTKDPFEFTRLQVMKALYQQFDRPSVSRIRRAAEQLRDWSDLDLENAARELQFEAPQRSRRQRFSTCFALVCEAIRRQYDIVPYDVQLQAGLALCDRQIVEMATGEGKTLTALFPLFVKAIDGQGMLLATANDYLANRDFEFGTPVLERLGIETGVVLDSSSDAQRRVAYQMDLTYGTASQFGFDFLRDRAKRKFNRLHPELADEQTVTRDSLYSILLDEADSLLVDDASTPLVISSSPPPIPPSQLQAFRWAAKLAPQATPQSDYEYSIQDQQIHLLPAGKRWVHSCLNQLGAVDELSMVDCYEFVERAILVETKFKEGREYFINNSEILLVDQSTGRVGVGRQWSEGIHQAVQAKEGLPLTMPNGTLASISLQSFLLSYRHLSGMTGTAKQAHSELKSVYDLRVVEIPPNRKCLRKELPALCYRSNEEWLSSIRQECEQIIQKGRSVLIGTRSVKLSELVADSLKTAGLQYKLINARQDKEEASIVAEAGLPGRITVATNMAGRGTDIELHPDVAAAGGLHVIVAGIHESERIDRQLIGRAGRQGDPGSYRILISLEDDLLESAFAEEADSLRLQLNRRFSTSRCLKLFRSAQSKITSRRSIQRRSFFHRDKTTLRHLHGAGLDPLVDCPT
ncbi:MAG: preprotein translocase subunit SecA [Aureliella sp.]